MKKYKGVIFDLDGTLLDTIEDLADSVNEVLSSYGYPEHGVEKYKQKVGNGFRNLLEVSLPEKVDNDKLDEIVERFVAVYDKNYKNKTEPYQGIDELLRNLAAKGIKLAVNSNKRTDYTKALIHKFFPHIPFIDIMGQREDIPKKPSPAAANMIAEKMGLSADDILYIGDSKTDMQTAANAKMDKAGVLWGFRDLRELKENGADYLFQSAKEIADLF